MMEAYIIGIFLSVVIYAIAISSQKTGYVEGYKDALSGRAPKFSNKKEV
jgi:hypothetical protein